jgi:hypothetical protein
LHSNSEEIIALVSLAVAITLSWRIKMVALRMTEKVRDGVVRVVFSRTELVYTLLKSKRAGWTARWTPGSTIDYPPKEMTLLHRMNRFFLEGAPEHIETKSLVPAQCTSTMTVMT